MNADLSLLDDRPRMEAATMAMARLQFEAVNLDVDMLAAMAAIASIPHAGLLVSALAGGGDVAATSDFDEHTKAVKLTLFYVEEMKKLNLPIA